MSNQDITDLYQNEDETLEFKVTINGVSITDVSSALFVVNNLEGTEAFRYELGANLSFDSSVGTFTVNLRDVQTLLLVGKYNYELWFKDSFGKDTLPFYGSLKFKSTFGRY